MVNTPSDEIDIAKLLTVFALNVKRNLRLILSLCMIGFLIGLSTTFVFVKQFESKMLINSDILTFSYAEELVKTLNNLIAESDKSLLAKKLHLPQKEAVKLTQLKIEIGVDQTEELKENQKNYLVITARTVDPSILPNLQKGLTKYLEDNEFVKIRVQQRKQTYLRLRSEVESQIKSLEELQKKISSGDFLAKSDGTLMFDPTMVNTKIIELTKEKINYENNLELVNSIQVIEGFTPFNRPVTGRKFTSSFIGAAIGLIIAFIIMGIKALNKSVKDLETTSV